MYYCWALSQISVVVEENDCQHKFVLYGMRVIYTVVSWKYYKFPVFAHKHKHRLFSLA